MEHGALLAHDEAGRYRQSTGYDLLREKAVWGGECHGVCSLGPQRPQTLRDATVCL